MAWTYSGDPANSEVDGYRFKVHDTIATEPILQDEEIQYVLDTYTSENLRLYKLYEAIYLYFLRGVKRTLGPQQEDPTGRQQMAKNFLDDYRKKMTLAGTPTSTGPTTDPVFSMEMHTND
jgi:hypothetical protein